MATIRRVIAEAIEAEDKIRAEISELFLLLKSGRLSEDEVKALKDRLDHLIGETKRKHDEHLECCG